VINSTGNVAGATIDFDFKPRGVRYVSGAPVDLNVGNIRSDVFGINDSDIIAGSFQNFTGDRAFRWKNGTTIDLGTLAEQTRSPSPSTTAARSRVLPKRRITTTRVCLAGFEQQRSVRSGEMVQLADYGLSSAGNTINAGGSVGGFALLPSFRREPTLWIAGVRTPLPTPVGSTDAEVFDLNVFGIAVGNASTGAVLWDENHNVFSLQSLISGPIPFTNLLRSVAINDAGLIIGIGRTAGGEEHGFLMTPVPEPGVASAAIALAGFSRRRIKSLM
jgi:probable HAF family extracellular repeat protein